MKTCRRTILPSLALAFALLLLPTGRALAYLDPGTGSYMIQILVAGALGIVYTLRSYWTSLFGGGAADLDEEEDEEREGEANDEAEEAEDLTPRS